MEQTLYQKLIEAKIPIDHYESDLYFPITDESSSILLQFPSSALNVNIFRDNVTKQMWYEVHFAYDPFWEKK
jgi:hypothetical protein